MDIVSIIVVLVDPEHAGKHSHITRLQKKETLMNHANQQAKVLEYNVERENI